MARYGYSYVNDKGFASFTRALSEGAWEEVSIAGYDSKADPPIAKASLIEAPLPVVWKLRATWTIRGLVWALGTATADDLLELDTEWDSAQRALNLALLTQAEDKDEGAREAAQRMRTTLLMGSGVAQTQLSYEKEVDFGRAQLDLARKAPLCADVKAAKLEPYLERIGEATEALAAGIGRGPGHKRGVPRSRRIRDALAACTTTFNVIHEELEWMIEHTAAGKARKYLEDLAAPFVALLERYPPRATTTAEDVDDEPSGATEPAPAQAAPA